MARAARKSDGDYLAPGTVYDNLDLAMHAASCLCNLHPDGATIYGTTDDALVGPGGEAYVIACKSTRSDGTTWTVPATPYAPVYTITGHSRG